MDSRIFKLSALSEKTSLQTRYNSMLAGNASYIPNNFESIATVTVGAGGSPTVSFSSIPQTYQHLQLRGILKSTNAGSVLNSMWIQFNGDTGSNYSWHQLYGYYTGSTASSGGSASQTYMYPGYIPLTDSLGGLTANVFNGIVIDISDYTSSKNKTMKVLSGFDFNNAYSYSGIIVVGSGAWYSTSAITSITFSTSGGNYAQFSSLALYGVK